KSINDLSRLAGILLEVFPNIEPGFQILHHRSWIFFDELGRGGHEDWHRIVVVQAHHGGGDPFGLGDGAVRVDADERVDGFGRRRGHHLVHVHLDLLIILLLQARAWRNDVHECVTCRRAHLVADLETPELLNLRDVEFLPRHHARALSHLLDLRDCDQPTLVVAGHEGLPGIGTEVHLPCHHLLHGEIAGGNGELLAAEPSRAPRDEESSTSAPPGCCSGTPDEWFCSGPGPLEAPPRPPPRDRFPQEPETHAALTLSVPSLPPLLHFRFSDQKLLRFVP